MHAATPTFWLEPTEEIAVGLRRYARADGTDGWDCAGGYHQALAYTGRQPARYADTDLGNRRRHLALLDPVPHDDPRWPAACAKGCGYRFTEDDAWQEWQELLYRRTDTGELRVLHTSAPAPFAPSAEPGACWDAWWMSDHRRGPDSVALMVRLPNGRDWCVDSQASNCTRKGEPHQCWVRHGDPRDCKVSVDKAGDTCAAGAGSILAGDYHGFLQAGVLTAG